MTTNPSTSPREPAPQGSQDVQNTEVDGSTRQAFEPADYALIERQGFELLQERFLPDTGSNLLLLRHKESGATVVSIHNSDECKWIRLGFTTVPSDSTGVFHKIEHAVLSGSKSMNVSEPFDEMTQSLLLTHVNASTYLTRTDYYAASTDGDAQLDAANIFLDAVLHANLSEDVFKREHGHLVPSEVNGKTVWKFAGVVHDEMLAQYAAPPRWLFNNLKQALFPGSPCAFDSGGNPVQMPKLTYEQFKDSYRSFYDPAAMVVVFSGNDSLSRRLEFLNQKLSGVQGRGTQIELPAPVVFGSPRKVELPYHVAPNSEKALERKYVADVAWKFPKVVDHQERLELDLLATLLSTEEYSPLTIKHRQSGLANVHMHTSFGSFGKQDVFWCNFAEGTRDSAKDTAEFVLSAIADISKRGIDREAIDAVLNSREYQKHDNLSAPVTRGDALTDLALRTVLERTVDFDDVSVFKRLEILREKLAAGERIFEGLIEKYLLNNSDRVDLIHVPDINLIRAWREAQQSWLDAEVKRLGAKGQEAQALDAHRLLEAENNRDSTAALSAFPVSTLIDSYRFDKPDSLLTEQYEGITVTRQPQATDGLAEIYARFDLQGVPPDKMVMAAFLAEIMLRHGKEQAAPGEFQARVGRDSGGIAFGVPVISRPNSAQSVEPDPAVALQFSVRAKPDHYVTSLRLLAEPILAPAYVDRGFVDFLIREAISMREMSLHTPGSVTRRVRGHLNGEMNVAGQLLWQSDSEQELRSLTELGQRVAHDWDNLLAEFRELHAAIFRPANLRMSVTVDEEHYSYVRPHVLEFIDALRRAMPADGIEAQTRSISKNLRGIAFPRPLENNYVGERATLLDSQGDRFMEHGKVEVLCALLDRFLKREVRSKGRAYGASADYDLQTSQITFTSWRDPNIISTFSAFHNAVKFLRTEVTEDYLQRAKVRAMNVYERPKSTFERGFRELRRSLSGITSGDVSKIRGEIMDTTLEDVHALAGILESALARGSARVVYGPGKSIDEAIAQGAELKVSK